MARIFFLDRSAAEDVHLNAAVDWLLEELDEPLSLESLRRLASRELARPRDAIHREWAKVFLRETVEYV
jgi:hypothetical protein